MHVRVVVGRFQPRKADQRATVAGHRVGDFLHHLAGHHGVHCPAHARFLEHGRDGTGGLAANGSRSRKLFAGGHLFLRQGHRPVVHDRLLDGLCRSGFFDLFRLLRLRGFGGHVQPFAGVDDHFAHGARGDFLQVLRVGDHELATPERVVHPGAAELLDVHAQLDIFNPYFFQHGVGSKWRKQAFSVPAIRALNSGPALVSQRSPSLGCPARCGRASPS